MLGETTPPLRFARTATLATVAALIVSAALAAAALGAGDSASAGAVVKTHKTSLETILVDARGRTLYLFMRDKRNKSSCSGACATNWPPLTTSGKPTAGTGAKASLLGRAMRSDGRMQVTYNGHPLYRFSLDSSAGQTQGEGVDADSAVTGTPSRPQGRRSCRGRPTEATAAAAVVTAAGGGYGGGGGGYGGGTIGG